MKRLKNYILSSLLVLSLLAVPVAFSGVGTVAAQDTQTELCKGANLSFDNPGTNCKGTGTGTPAKTLDKLVETIVNVVSVIVGIAAVIMIIFGGFKYVTSGGDSNRVASAKNTIIYALVGLLIVAFAQFIVRFIIGKTAQ